MAVQVVQAVQEAIPGIPVEIQTQWVLIGVLLLSVLEGREEMLAQAFLLRHPVVRGLLEMLWLGAQARLTVRVVVEEVLVL
jgi:hypothetical protein